MNALINQLSTLGQASLNFFWFPMLIWTALALLVHLGLRMFRNISALYQYHLRTALLAALPAGLFSWSLMNWYLAADAIRASSAKIIYVMNPITVTTQPTAPSTGFSVLTPELGIGILFLMFLAFALYQLIRFIVHFRSLYAYKKSMTLMPIQDFPDLSNGNKRLLQHIPAQIHIAVSDEPQIPSTFGWKKPVIVVPALLCSNTTKLNLAIRHELIHIKQNDYLVNIGVQLVSRVFRFHLLVGRIAREIHEYSEITCDEEVLSDTSIPAKHYAYLLFELLQLPVINQNNMVNMAHPNSNIKKRIHAMTHSNHKNNSIRISFSLFMLILVSISMIMACSGLRNQDTSGKALLGQNFQIQNPTITINGLNTQKYFGGLGTGPALGILYFKTPAHGTFLISGQSFDGAQPVGSVKGKTLSFNTNQLNVKIVCTKPILPVDNTNIWVKHIADGGSIGSNQHLFGFAGDYQSYMKMDFTQKKNYKTGPDGKQFFVVAEKMPQLIGGLASVQGRIQYPDSARKAGIQGRVFVEFIVDKEGNVENPKVMRGIGGGCDVEAVRVVKKAKFTPGMKDGKPVNVRYSLPIIFSLSNTGH